MNGIKIQKFKDKKPFRAFIFTGGKNFSPQKMTDIPDGKDLVIAADSGCEAVLAFSSAVCKTVPDIIVGDMDSYDVKKLGTAFPDSNFLPFPPEKDYTDTALAVSVALECGCREIIIAGGLGGRLDHTFANVFLLEHIRAKGAKGIITDGKNRAYIAESENIFYPCTDESKRRKYISLIPLDAGVRNIVMDENFKYPYMTELLERRLFVTVSNEIIRYPATIKIGSGTALIAECGE